MMSILKKGVYKSMKVSMKQTKPMIEAIIPLVASIRVEVEKMPECTKRKSLLLSIANLEKKTAIIVKEVSESEVMEYVNRHPEVLQKLAHFAASDKGAIEVSSEIVTSEELDSGKKLKRRH
jgi:hypothetical protein